MLPLLTSILLTAATSTTAPTLAPTGPEVTAYDQTLTPITGTLISVNDRRVVLTVEGRERTIDNAAAIIARQDNVAPSPSPSRPTPTNPAPTPRIQFDLTDGQRWITPLATVRFDAERIFTPLSPAAAPLKLDQVRRIIFGIDPSPLATAPAADTVHLRSGDTLTGFVASITTTGDKGEFAVALESAASGSTSPATPRTIKHDTLRSLTLTNPLASKSAVRAWLADGQRLAASSSFSGAEWTLTPEQKDTAPIKLAADSLRAALLAPGVITPLSSLPIKADSTGDAAPSFGPEAALGMRDINIPEPQTVSWALPASKGRLTLTIALREDCLAWGDCSITLAIARAGKTTELLRTSLSSAQPSASLSTDLPSSGGELTLTIDPGKHGPVQDRIVIRNAMLGTGK